MTAWDACRKHGIDTAISYVGSEVWRTTAWIDKVGAPSGCIAAFQRAGFRKRKHGIDGCIDFEMLGRKPTDIELNELAAEIAELRELRQLHRNEPDLEK
jgi:hypothetical protein